MEASLRYSQAPPRVQFLVVNSLGALIAAMICVRTDDELNLVFSPDVFSKMNKGGSVFDWDNIKHLYHTGAVYSFNRWYDKIVSKITLGETMTFMEAYQRTGRILNITVVPDEPYSSTKLLNYITSPDVIIASAVIASSAIPHILNPGIPFG